MKKAVGLLLFGFFLCFTGTAQNFEVPQNVVLKEKEDYAKYEADIIAAAKWLEATPIGSQTEKRTQVNAFVMQWVTGSPTVTIEMGNFAVAVSEDNPQLLMVLIAGYTRFALENGYRKDAVAAYAAAMRSVIRCYELGGDVNKNKLISKAIAKEKEGKLQEWISAQLKK